MIIEKAQIDDLAEIKYICDKHSKELGFVKRVMITEAIEKNFVFVAREDDKIIGFVEYRQRRDEQTTLNHIAVHPDCKGRGIGKALIDRLAKESRSLNKELILLKCPEELAANHFYKNYGFELLRVDPGKNRRINVWRLSLYENNQFNC